MRSESQVPLTPAQETKPGRKCQLLGEQITWDCLLSSQTFLSSLDRLEQQESFF